MAKYHLSYDIIDSEKDYQKKKDYLFTEIKKLQPSSVEEHIGTSVIITFNKTGYRSKIENILKHNNYYHYILSVVKVEDAKYLLAINSNTKLKMDFDTYYKSL